MRSRRKALTALTSVAFLACVVLAGCGGGAGEVAGGGGPSSPPFRFFSPQSFWNSPVRADASLDRESARIVDRLDATVAAEEREETGPWIGTTEYSVPIYTVPRSQPTVRVRLTSRFGESALRAAWKAVPLPADARPAAGSDRHLVVWQPASQRMWEFWKLRRRHGRWQAAWGGAIDHVADDPGVYSRSAWPGATPRWGASASSLSIAGGLITLEDFEKGAIDHALAIALPEVRAGDWASPARRTDGRAQNPAALPEGAHLRLDPHLDLAKLHLPRPTLLIARAAQRYGIYVRDGGGVISFYAQAPHPGDNPYRGPGGYFEGRYPNQLLASFPWHHLELLRMHLHGGRER